MEGDPLSFAHLANEPKPPGPLLQPSPVTLSSWEAIRANWTRKPVTPPSNVQESGGRSLAQRLVSGSTISTPVALGEVISCLVVKWEEEETDVNN